MFIDMHAGTDIYIIPLILCYDISQSFWLTSLTLLMLSATKLKFVIPTMP